MREKERKNETEKERRGGGRRKERAKESGRTLGRERYRAPTIGATVGLDIATAGSGTPLQGGSGWSISGALYVTNLRTRRSLMPVRGPWCGRVCARGLLNMTSGKGWVGEEGRQSRESGAERDPGALLGFLNVRRAASSTRDCPRSSRYVRLRLRLHGQRCRTGALFLPFPPFLFLSLSRRKYKYAPVSTSNRSLGDARRAKVRRNRMRSFGY